MINNYMKGDEMKNKDRRKSKEYFRKYGLAIFAIILFGGGLLIIYLPESVESQFKITKEKCETEILEDSDIMANDVLHIIPEQGVSEYIVSIINGKFKFVRCEQVEVEEIELDRLYADELEREVNIYHPNMEQDCGLEINSRFYCSFTISKKDLSTEWLNENGGCIGGVTLGEIESGKTIRDECSKWKIGDFTIEVIQ